MLKAVSFASVLAIVAGANAAVSVGSVDMGGSGGSFGSAITSSTAIYQNVLFGNNYPPSSAFIGVFGASLAEDSYVAIDSNGPSSASYTSAGPGGAIPGFSATTGFFPNANTLTGGYFTAGNVAGGSNGQPGVLSSVFIARITNANGGTLTGDNIRILLGGEGATAYQFALNGATVVGSSGTVYRLKSYASAGANGTVNDIYVEEVPAPGFAALAGVAGLAGLRRRRA